MVNSTNKLLRSVIDSKHGIHLSIYVKFDGNQALFQEKLNQLLLNAEVFLSPAMEKEERTKFLKPIRDLLDNHDSLSHIKGNLGLFRKNDFFRYVSLPIQLEETCVVADSFHIKPLINWAQQDQDFVLVGFAIDGVHVYKGSQSEFKRVHSISLPKKRKTPFAKNHELSRLQNLSSSMLLLAERIEDLSRGQQTTVFVAGQKSLIAAFLRKFKSDALYPETLSSTFAVENVYETCQHIRALLRLDSRARLNEALKEFEFAHKSKIAKSNIFQIAKSAIKGDVRKLIIAEDLHLFGKINFSTGGIALHALDMDHEDDCLLDDLAQTVLLKGGEVVIAKRSEIPAGRPIMAVLFSQQADLNREAEIPMNMAL